jgi:ribosomal protein S18 acetylase RimI-like enzyme
MISIRQMQEADLESVRIVDAAAFTPWWRKLTGKQAALPPRTLANVTCLLEKDPEGCFVAQDGGCLIGLIFSRTWGSVGWPGTFAVLPDYQGRGIGQRLLAASLAYLRQEPERTIGLETMPDIPSNLGLYLKHGFRLSPPTLLLSKQVGTATVGAGVQWWSRSALEARERWLRNLRELTHRIRPGLDVSKEITSTVHHGFGDTLVLATGTRPIGFSSVWLTGTREGAGGDSAVVQIAALDPEHTSDDGLRALLGAIEALACAHDRQEIVVPVNARRTWALDRLLDLGYRVERLSARMLLAGTDSRPLDESHVILSRWAG